MFCSIFHYKTSKNTYRDVKESGFVEGPALDEVEEGLLRLLDVHADQGLVMHGHMLLLQVDQSIFFMRQITKVIPFFLNQVLTILNYKMV